MAWRQTSPLCRGFCADAASRIKILPAPECARADIAATRRLWRPKRQFQMGGQLHRLVLIDEASVTKMKRLRGRSRKGKQLKATAPFGWWNIQTFTGTLRCDGLTAPWIIDPAMNRATFDACVETQPASTLHKSDVVILDNLAVHESPKAAAYLKSADT